MAAVPWRAGDDRFTGEQAALRRVATLVARGTPPEAVFAAVAEEAGWVLGADRATLARFNPDGTATVIASWTSASATFPVGSQWSIGGRNLLTLVFQTGQAARIDDYADAAGSGAKARELGVRAAIGVPVSVEGRVWGVMTAGSMGEPFPVGTEARLAGFTELAAAAIANAQARVELRGYAEEQAALRRLAMLVAEGAAPEKVLTAVAKEVGRLLGVEYTAMTRYDPDGFRTVVAAWSNSGPSFPIGTRTKLGGRNVTTLVRQTGQPARIDDYASEASGPIAEAVGTFGSNAAVGAPITVEGRLWGVMVLDSRSGPLPPGTEARLAGFTELAGTAIANAEARTALAASRARTVAAADATRRRIERNLHDGAQQRLVSLTLDLRAAEAAAAAGIGDLVPELDRVAAGLDGVLADLREIARGLHPAVLADGGLAPALKTLARRSAVPAHLDILLDRRLPEPVEIAAYYTVAEALTNGAKHAGATALDIEVSIGDGVLHVRVRDNGCGGANFDDGTGLVGLKDRAEALGGRLWLDSPPGAGTTLEISLPLDASAPAEPLGRQR
ncbi:MAG TPA: GAF domain-containing sensor histidine kinase [Streptosporangiaceae bacterium]|nr:GAF domain-containing sensor histidine kinase [Streptosporangiaceae bacterium]